MFFPALSSCNFDSLHPWPHLTGLLNSPGVLLEIAVASDGGWNEANPVEGSGLIKNVRNPKCCKIFDHHGFPFLTWTSRNPKVFSGTYRCNNQISDKFVTSYKAQDSHHLIIYFWNARPVDFESYNRAQDPACFLVPLGWHVNRGRFVKILRWNISPKSPQARTERCWRFSSVRKKETFSICLALSQQAITDA